MAWHEVCARAEAGWTEVPEERRLAYYSPRCLIPQRRHDVGGALRPPEHLQSVNPEAPPQ
jgi:hypothetical protein